MNSIKCVLAVALGAGVAVFATGCVVQTASGEGDTNTAEVSPVDGTQTSQFHKIPPGQGQPQAGNPGIYPWPSPWYGGEGNNTLPPADLSSVQSASESAAMAGETQTGGDPESHRASSDVARTPTTSNEPNTGPDPNTVRRKP
jgi:hypothetical protein